MPTDNMNKQIGSNLPSNRHKKHSLSHVLRSQIDPSHHGLDFANCSRTVGISASIQQPFIGGFLKEGDNSISRASYHSYTDGKQYLKSPKIDLTQQQDEREERKTSGERGFRSFFCVTCQMNVDSDSSDLNHVGHKRAHITDYYHSQKHKASQLEISDLEKPLFDSCVLYKRSGGPPRQTLEASTGRARPMKSYWETSYSQAVSEPCSDRSWLEEPSAELIARLITDVVQSREKPGQKPIKEQQPRQQSLNTKPLFQPIPLTCGNNYIAQNVTWQPLSTELSVTVRFRSQPVQDEESVADRAQEFHSADWTSQTDYDADVSEESVIAGSTMFGTTGHKDNSRIL